MTNVLDWLRLPQSVPARVLEDLRRLADAGAAVGALAGEIRVRMPSATQWAQEVMDILASAQDHLAGLRRALEPMSHDLDAVRAAFAGTNDQLEELRGVIVPELAGVREEVRLERTQIESLNSELERVATRLAGEISGLRQTLVPLVHDADEIREVVEPLETASERLGRFAERLPGPGRKRAQSDD